jgi:amino acid transporter
MTSDSEKEASPQGHGFGTAPVFLASISTILGAIMFLRFGYAVGHAGVAGTVLIILLGHLVTIPTALAIAEIATNRRVEGGGEYFIISRSFGTTIGGTIGIALFLSQSISVAFYMIAFAEAFSPVFSWAGLPFDPRVVSLPGIALLLALMLTRGAALGVTALYAVVATLALSLALFFLGEAPIGVDVTARLDSSFEPDPIIYVFAIIFPAFTGMTAGVGLSGDLANPRRSIPLGVLSATVVGLVVYVLIVLKLDASADQQMLVQDQLVMSRIAIWGPIIPIGLAAATLSSAIGSILVAPRTLQALAHDRIIAAPGVTERIARGVGKANEPRNATIVTAAIAFVVAVFGNVDMVARIISMFFMVTYGALCAISFLEHFSARPSYRPSFRSKWYISLVGAVACLFLMFQMDPLFAIVALVIMAGLYLTIERSAEHANDLSTIFSGVMTQLTRWLQVRLQKMPGEDWRPSLIMISDRTFQRSAGRRLLAWLCHRYGVGTYLHYIHGMLDEENYRESLRVLKRLIDQTEQTESAVYVDTIISPSMRSALAQALQLPGVSGMENNTVLFEFSTHDGDDVVGEVAEGLELARVYHMNGLVLRHGDRHFGGRRSVHVWLTAHDHRNATLMILLAYILLGHPEWRRAELTIFAAYESQLEERARTLKEMITTGRIPVTEKNIQIISTSQGIDVDRLIEAKSSEADLVLLGLGDERLRHQQPGILRRCPALHEVLWVSAREDIGIE